MRKAICLGMGATLAFAMSVYAQNYKINKVGTDEQKSFEVLLDQTVVTEAPEGSWLTINPIIPTGKIFTGFTVYDEYGNFPNSQRVSETGKDDTHFSMPNHDVYVRASFESLRYFLTVVNTDNGTVELDVLDRYKDRAKPGIKVTVNPKANEGYKVDAVKVSKKDDDKTSVACVAEPDPANKRCSFDMPEFDVVVTATFVSESTSSSSSEDVASSSSSSENIVSSSSEDFSSSSSSDVVESSSSSENVASSSSEKKSSSSSAKSTSSSSVKNTSSSSAKSTSSSSVKNTSSSSAKATSSSSAKKTSSSSAKSTSSSSAKKTSSSSVKATSSSSVKNTSSSSAKSTSSSSAKKTSSSSVKAASSSSVKKTSSSSVKASSSSSAKKTSSSSVKAKSSSSVKAKSSSSAAPVEIVVEAVGTEEDMPSCTAKRENMTYYVTDLKTVFVCKSRVWTKFSPEMGLEKIAPVSKFSAVVNGRNLQISGAKTGSQVSLFDMQGRVMYNGKVDASDFSLNVVRSGTFLLRVGTQQQVVNVR